MSASTRIIFAIVMIGIAPLWWAWARLTDHYAAAWINFVAPAATVLLGLIWYLIFGPKGFLKRLGIFLGMLVALFGLSIFLKGNLVYGGSADGSSRPRLEWKNNVSTTEKLPVIEKTIVNTTPDTPLPGLADNLQFLGKGGDGQWLDDELTARFDNWTESPPKELWRIPVGSGWSGFAVSGRRALTMEQLGEEETVMCYDVGTGNLLWKTGVDARYYSDAPSEMTKMAGDGPRATPTVVGDNVFTYGATGVLLCLNLADGEILWQKNAIGSLGMLPEWGKSSSVLYVEEQNLVVVSGPEKDGPSLIAFDAATGDKVWEYREERLEEYASENFGGSYSTPRLVELLGMPQILSVNASSLSGVNPETGEQYWRFIWPNVFPKVSQPHVISDDGKEATVLVTSSYGAGTYLVKVTTDGETEPVWKSTRLKTKFSSAVVKDGYAYGLDEAKPAAIDLATGYKVWKARADYKFGQNLLVGDHVLMQAEPGHVAVFKASPEGFEEVGRIDNALDSMTWNTPTLAGRYLLIRNDREAICYQLPAR